MGNLTFQQMFRYALAGGITLAVVLGVYVVPVGKSDKLYDAISLAGVALLSAAALVIGGLLYTLHRATVYPVLYRVMLLVGPLRLKRGEARAWNVLWPSNEELDRDIARWKKRSEEASPASGLSEWATQIHYLYCSAWGILVGHLAGGTLGWASRPSLCRLSFWLVVVFFVAGVYHHARHLFFESKVLSGNGQTTGNRDTGPND